MIIPAGEMSRKLGFYQLPLMLQRSDKTVCHSDGRNVTLAGVMPTPFDVATICTVHKLLEHLLKSVRQIWAMESTEASRG